MTPEPDTSAPPPGSALRAAMDRLARRDWSRRALVEQLVRRGFETDAAEEAVATCVERGWLDEAAAARDRAASIARRGGADPSFLAARLEAHGVDPEVARDAAAATVPDPLAAAAAAIEAARPRRREPDARDRRRIAARLARRGFDEDVIRMAMEQAGLPVESLE